MVMRTLTHTVAGDECFIYIPQDTSDMPAFIGWLNDRGNKPLALDTETTGLGVFGAGFGVRLIQIGDEREAWVLQANLFAGWATTAIRRHKQWILHNAAYDLQVLDKVYGITLEELTPKVVDTIILSKLVEPHRRGGHKLKPLSEEHVDEFALDTADGLVAHFNRLGFTKETGWRLIDIHDELYNRYAGLDVIYTARLYAVLMPLVRERLVTHLATFEHTIQGYLNVMRRRGVLVDADYATWQRENFLRSGEQHLTIVREEYGLQNLNSTAQVADALLRSGAQLIERNAPTKANPAGSFKVGKEVLLPLAGFDEYWNPIEGFENPNPLAEHIALGKRDFRFADAYLGKFLDLMDENGRIHTNITGLEARTSRMAASDPPIQQLPAGDWKVRRAIVADPGNDFFSTDYAQIEMRIVAQLAGIRKMKEAILNGLDLHGYTAELAYGPGWTKQNRTHMKGAGFGIVYGGGAKGLAPKLGISYAAATRVVRAYNRVYPEIKRYSNKLQRDAKANGMVLRSPTGRILALDRDRTYAAINYMVQSTAADVLKNALEALFSAGLGDYINMPIHDEFVGQAPKADVADVAKEVARVMQTTIGDMILESDAEVYGSSWGHGYGDAEKMGAWF
ncbi:DNA polymerase I [Microbacterium phage Coltrane]|uniref:DNA polymerase I n=5 Tax=Armstrongvirus armstrong TaxID=2734217 RepID=A0A3G2KDF5_9CAUD|nr:DNA polymerase I [Microbacterium phage Armstrong]AYN55911.1 DNA polymerase I [Microbacterium phage Brahms]AYN57017.1 DNA polymerase I [Microbacterium phage Bernstein]AYN57376.1 DNA polymerase I [Microbacterium phage Coltrane]AYN58964.1 DNA polymerase I [Microbacterium phage Rollins]QED11463.1 DNA polymerase I [Microbacterium phage Vitas]